MTTFNYILTHQVIPDYVLRNLDFFYEKILTDPADLQHFMQVCVQCAADYVKDKPEFEQPYPVEKFEMQLHVDNPNTMERGLVCIQMPDCKEVCDCLYIVFPILREKAGYYTHEVAFNPVNNEPGFSLGRWMLEGDDLKHINYGVIDTEGEKKFLEMIADIVYGEKKNEI